jgi:hypothetical protein
VAPTRRAAPLLLTSFAVTASGNAWEPGCLFLGDPLLDFLPEGRRQ